MAGFNPHPSRRTGATFAPGCLRTNRFGFNPHPSRRTGATVQGRRVYRGCARFNPHPSRRTGATHTSASKILAYVVSILTRPEGRVQQLTKVQGDWVLWFQSSPVPKDGCNSARRWWRCWSAVSFNPHPSRRTGATNKILGEIRMLKRFNPHPSRRTGATGIMAGGSTMKLRFNPHPSRRTGATGATSASPSVSGVSILTRPEGRVQLELHQRVHPYRVFQSSPVPKDGCNS